MYSRCGELKSHVSSLSFSFQAVAKIIYDRDVVDDNRRREPVGEHLPPPRER